MKTALSLYGLNLSLLLLLFSVVVVVVATALQYMQETGKLVSGFPEPLSIIEDI